MNYYAHTFHYSQAKASTDHRVGGERPYRSSGSVSVITVGGEDDGSMHHPSATH
jgi:hypothetical protein